MTRQPSLCNNLFFYRTSTLVYVVVTPLIWELFGVGVHSYPFPSFSLTVSPSQIHNYSTSPYDSDCCFVQARLLSVSTSVASCHQHSFSFYLLFSFDLCLLPHLLTYFFNNPELSEICPLLAYFCSLLTPSLLSIPPSTSNLKFLLLCFLSSCTHLFLSSVSLLNLPCVLPVVRFFFSIFSFNTSLPSFLSSTFSRHQT